MSFVSPLDLLTVTDHEQDVIRCLVRRPRLTAVEIARLTKIPLQELNDLLESMVQNARLSQASDSTFQVKMGREKSTKRERSKPSLLSSLFD